MTSAHALTLPLDTQPARRVPSDLAERVLLGRLLSLGNAQRLGGEFDQVAALKVSDFSKRSHQLIWHAMNELVKRADRLSSVTVQTELDKPLKNNASLRAIDEVTEVYLTGLLEHRAGDILECAKIIRRHAFRRKVKAVAREIDQTVENDSLSESRVMDVIAQHVTDLTRLSHALDGHPSVTVHDSVALFWDHMQIKIEARKDGEISGYGVTMGVHAVDDVTCGFQRGKLYVVAAYTGFGKSSFAVRVAHASLEQGARAVIIPLEMDHLEMTQRMISLESGIDGTRLMTGNVDPSDLPRLGASCETIMAYQQSHQCHYLEFEPRPTIHQIEAKLASHMAVHGADIIVLDQLSLEAISGPRPDSKPLDYLGDAITRLKVLAQKYNIPVIVMTQLNRAGNTSGEERPTLSHIANSDSFVKAAFAVILLWRDKTVAGPVQPMDIIFAKHRGGWEGTKHAHFIAPLTKIVDCEDRP